MLPRLTLNVARQLSPEAERLDAIRSAPVRVLQIGTGNFLRAFCGWMFERMNRCGLFHGSIAVAQATPGSRTLQAFREQDGCYTVLQRGLESDVLVEKTDLVTCVTKTINPYAEWSDLLALAARPELRFVVSNTTEAGIVFQPIDSVPQGCPSSFPAQMTALLHHRFVNCRGARNAGLVLLPCELTENNGRLLREIVLRHAADWRLGDDLTKWISEKCIFCNTLVDRIVTGYPTTEADRLQAQLGYRDSLLVACEWYHSWIIEGPSELACELPFEQAGLNVRRTDDLAPYRTRKVRILNGAHTIMTPVAYLAGCDTVLQTMNDPLLSGFLQDALCGEILPTLEARETREFAADVLTRFRNPTIQHRLLSISLNSTSKWKVRVLPSLQQYVGTFERLPRRLSFSLAALIVLYRVRVNEDGVGIGTRGGQPYQLRDTPEALGLLSQAWKAYEEQHDAMTLARTVLSSEKLWDMDLNTIAGLAHQVAADLELIGRYGMRGAMEHL